MTVVAVDAARNVRRMFPGRGGSVVTGSTCSHHLRVIDRESRQKGESIVAILADIARLYVSRAFSSGG